MRSVPRIIIILSLAILITGCATAPKMNRLSIGMSKQEVTSIMGRPDSTSDTGDGTELLHYKLSTKGGPFMDVATAEDYIVKIVSGKVVAFGKAQDFQSQSR